MTRFASFEVCGLHFILQRCEKDSGNRTHFQLCDEAFSSEPIKISVDCYDDLFLQTEAHIGLELNEEQRDALCSRLGSIEKQKRVLNGLTSVLGKSNHESLASNSTVIAVGV